MNEFPPRVSPGMVLALALAGGVACGPRIESPPHYADAPSADPRQAFERIAAESGGQVGVSTTHVESGARISFTGDVRFPMASTYKLAIAVAVLDLVDCGEMRLQDVVRLQAGDMRPGRLARGAPREGLTTTVAWLLEAMLVESDNTASDALLRVAGGAPAVSARLHTIGVEGIRVDRSELQIELELVGASTEPPPSEGWTEAEIESRVTDATPEELRAAGTLFSKDPRDTATPDAMVYLLAQVARGHALSPESTARLLTWMQATKTGPRRLGGTLPEGTVVAHKAGTIVGEGGHGIATNDVGIVTLPSGQHFAIAVFVRDSSKPLAARERAIAEIARAAYDYWSAR